MIEFNEVNYLYKDGTKALNSIDFDTSSGNIIALVGANGAGKTTLILNALGLLKPNSGSINISNQPIKYDKKFLMNLRMQVGIVFQNPEQQIFYSNVYDDIAFGLRNLKMPEVEVAERVKWAMDMVEANDIKDKPVHFLSYGQKKRVAIAGVLALKHKVLFFDEPTAGLDPYLTTKIIDILKKISQSGIKIVISSHDMDLIYSLCDYGYIINSGKILKSASIDTLFLDTDIIKEAHITQPWMVKMHLEAGIPLFKTENELMNYIKLNTNKY